MVVILRIFCEHMDNFPCEFSNFACLYAYITYKLCDINIEAEHELYFVMIYLTVKIYLFPRKYLVKLCMQIFVIFLCWRNQELMKSIAMSFIESNVWSLYTRTSNVIYELWFLICVLSVLIFVKHVFVPHKNIVCMLYCSWPMAFCQINIRHYYCDCHTITVTLNS